MHSSGTRYLLGKLNVLRSPSRNLDRYSHIIILDLHYQAWTVSQSQIPNQKEILHQSPKFLGAPFISVRAFKVNWPMKIAAVVSASVIHHLTRVLVSDTWGTTQSSCT